MPSLSITVSTGVAAFEPRGSPAIGGVQALFAAARRAAGDRRLGDAPPRAAAA